MAEEKNKPVTETPDGTRVVRTVGRDFRNEGNDVDGYIGVSPEYRNYASETDKPYITEADIELLDKGEQPTDVEALTLAFASRVPAVEQESDEEPKNADEDDKGESDEGPKKSDEKKAEAPAPVKSTPAKAAPAKAAS